MARKKHRQKQKQMRQKPQPKIVKTKSNRKLWIAFAAIAVVIIADFESLNHLAKRNAANTDKTEEAAGIRT